jgi:hypothetical protein
VSLVGAFAVDASGVPMGGCDDNGITGALDVSRAVMARGPARTT